MTAFADWIGRSTTQRDMLGATPVLALAAALDHEPQPVEPGTMLPPLAHWLYFLPLVRASETGPDGHPRRGGFLPPVTLPRRMWASGRLEYHMPLNVGDLVERRSVIEAIEEKSGRTGELIFVTVRHELRRVASAAGGAPARTEWQHIVYREEPKTPAVGEPEPAAPSTPAQAAWRRELVPDEVLLFRYSALTLNGHRIHYDHPYGTRVEGYPGLVVHGPLIATLLADLLQREVPRARLATFSFRAVRPSFAGRPLVLAGQPAPDGRSAQLWAADREGRLAMSADASWR
jgi:3-methylfumaryl-CoA hydratase